MNNDDKSSDQELREEREWFISRITQMAGSLDAERLNELYDFAGELSVNPRLLGGPFDGLRLTIPDDDLQGYEFDEGFAHTWDHGQGVVAVYEVDAKGRLVFAGFEKENHPEMQNGHQG